MLGIFERYMEDGVVGGGSRESEGMKREMRVSGEREIGRGRERLPCS